MNPALLPMLLLALLLLSTDDPDAGTVALVLSGDRVLTGQDDAVVVADAEATVPHGTVVSGPVYVIGGTTRIDGRVRGRVTQIAGTVVLGDEAVVDTVRHIGGRELRADGAVVRRRTDVEVAPADNTPLSSLVPVVLTTAFLALVGAGLARRRRRNVDRMAQALRAHPVITVTVGLLLTLTLLSVFVFMAFTLVLIPVSLLGLVVGLAIVGLGVVAWGHLLAGLAGRRRPAATAVGVVAVMAVLQVAGLVPVVGDLLVAFVLLSGLGAVIVTYLGFAEFAPAALPA
jgi:hypothetical protein